MKHSSNKKSVFPVAKQNVKKTLISTKTNATVKKNADISATKPKPTKTKISAAKSKTLKLKTSAPIRKIKIPVSKKKQIPSVQTVKSETKTTKPKNFSVKNEIVKPQPVVPAKKTEIVKRQEVADKIKNEKTKKSILVKKVPTAKLQPRVSAKKKTPENKKNNQTAKIAKTAKLPTNTAIRKDKAVKSQALDKIEKPVKSQSKISEIKSKTANAKSKVIVRKNPVKKDAAVKRNKVQTPSVKIENKKLNSRISKIAKVGNQKIVAVHLVKKLKLPATITKPKNKKNYKRKQTKLIVKAEQPMPIIPKLKPKKAKAISSAVFRGAKNRYDFTVFPIDAVFEDVPAIYIISRRVVDKSKKAHHALVCIGQTESLLDELKKHKKDKRAKKFAANSISLLHEENENRRLKIETDLKAAHAIRCLYA